VNDKWTVLKFHLLCFALFIHLLIFANFPHKSNSIEKHSNFKVITIGRSSL
jgi:hypothetical protein